MLEKLIKCFPDKTTGAITIETSDWITGTSLFNIEGDKIVHQYPEAICLIDLKIETGITAVVVIKTFDLNDYTQLADGSFAPARRVYGWVVTKDKAFPLQAQQCMEAACTDAHGNIVPEDGVEYLTSWEVVSSDA